MRYFFVVTMEMVVDIVEWLQSLGFDEYTTSFVELVLDASLESNHKRLACKGRFLGVIELHLASRWNDRAEFMH